MARNKRILNNIRLAIELAGDGGPAPFKDKEYNEMYDLLNKVEKLIK